MAEQQTVVRAPGSKGKWHLIGLDRTECDRWIGGDDDHVPRDTVDPADVCAQCTRWEKPYEERRRPRHG